jgi:broad specificity phosphatase PhoE
MATTVVIARHGEIFTNVRPHRSCDGDGVELTAEYFKPPAGKSYDDLNVRGEEQSELLAERIDREFEIDAVLCSSARRAAATLEPQLPNLEARSVPITYTPHLREHECGDLSNLGDYNAPDWRQKYEAAYRHELEEWIFADPVRHTPNNFRFRGAESADEFSGRVIGELDRGLQVFRDRTLLVMGHGHVNQAILRRLNHETVRMPGYDHGNTAVSVLVLEALHEPATIRYLGDQSHLPPKLRMIYKRWGAESAEHGQHIN